MKFCDFSNVVLSYVEIDTSKPNMVPIRLNSFLCYYQYYFLKLLDFFHILSVVTRNTAITLLYIHKWKVNTLLFVFNSSITLSAV